MQLLGLGQYQNRTYQPAVTHLHLACFAYALLTHLRIMRPGAQGQRIYDKAADWSTAAAQEQLRGLIWETSSPTSRKRTMASPFSQHWSVFTSPERAKVSQLE